LINSQKLALSAFFIDEKVAQTMFAASPAGNFKVDFSPLQKIISGFAV
jgi:hypothetical protein